MTYVFAPTEAPPAPRERTKNLRQKSEESFSALLTAVLTNGLTAALEAGDHARAVVLINRGFAEGTPELGCDLLRQAMTSVGCARTWTVQLAPVRGASAKASLTNQA